MPSLLDDPEAYAFAAQVAEDRRRKLTDQQALNAILQGVGDLPYTLLGAPVDISTGLLRAGGMAQGEQVGGIDYIKRKATELGIRPPDSDDPTMRDMRMGAEIVSGAIDPTRVARAGGAVAGAVAREAKPIIGDALENYMARSGLAPRVAPENGLLGQTSKSLSDIENKFKDVSLDLYEKNNTINLSRIVVPKDIRNSGVGTDVMQDLISYADQTGQKVALTPSSDFGGDVKKLKEFYKQFGFVENKGKNKDFTTRESMIRPAKEQEMSGSQNGLLSATPVNDVAETLIYHGTSPSAAKSIEKSGFDVAQAADGTIWFTTNPAIGEVAATAKGAVVSRSLNESNLKLATWDDIDKYSVDELINMGYDGVKMPSGNETTYQIFNPEKLTKLSNKSAAPQAEALKTAQKNAALPIEKGGLGLPKDNTPMDRAKAMGFDLDTFRYHGSDADIYAFDPQKFGKNDQGWYGRGVTTDTDPEIASGYANYREPESGQVIYPLVTKGKYMDWPEGQQPFSSVSDSVAGTKDIQNLGYSGTRFTNDRDLYGSTPDIGTEQVTFNPSNVRSIFAAFDPMRKNESNILAGALPFGILGADEETKKDMRSLLGY